MEIPIWLAVLTALGGGAGIAALLKTYNDGRHNAKQADIAAQQAQIDSLCKTIKQLQDENRRLSQRVAAYESEIIELRGIVSMSQIRIDDSQTKIVSLEHSNRTLNDLVAAQQREIANSQAKIIDLERSNKILRRELQKAQHNIAELVVENEELRKNRSGPDE